MVCSTFFNFFWFSLRNFILQSAKDCEMTSFSTTSLHVDLKEAAKCVDIIPLTLLASLSRLRNSYKMQNGDDVWPDLLRFINKFMKVGGIRSWKNSRLVFSSW